MFNNPKGFTGLLPIKRVVRLNKKNKQSLVAAFSVCYSEISRHIGFCDSLLFIIYVCNLSSIYEKALVINLCGNYFLFVNASSLSFPTIMLTTHQEQYMEIVLFLNLETFLVLTQGVGLLSYHLHSKNAREKIKKLGVGIK